MRSLTAHFEQTQTPVPAAAFQVCTVAVHFLRPMPEVVIWIEAYRLAFEHVRHLQAAEKFASFSSVSQN